MADSKGGDVVVTAQKKERPTAKGLGITTEKPKFPQYAKVSQRAESYEELHWPDDAAVSVESLIEAGLVYTGVEDSVRCYHCGGGLRNWEKGDDPMVEHARWYPTCPHVLLVRGLPFIQKIADGEPAEQPPDSPKVAFDEQVDLSTSAAQATMEMGYGRDDVLKAIHVFRHRNGNITFRGSDLCQILIELSENPHVYEEVERARAQVSAGSEVEENYEELVEENRRLKETKMCKVCHERLADVVLLPCGHRNCALCAPSFTECPEEDCGHKVNGMVKAFYATQAEFSVMGD